MINKDFILPFYAKSSIFFVGMVALVSILYVAQSIIVPLIFALIIAILLNPVVHLFVKIKVNRVVAITITILLTFVLIFAFGALVFSQASQFSESWPKLVDKFTILLNQCISSAAGYFDMQPQHLHAWIIKTQNELVNINGTLIGETIVSVGSSVAVLLLIPVYVFIILYYKPLLMSFIQQVFVDKHQNEATEIVTQIKVLIQHYLVGLLIEAAIVATLDAMALLVLGIEYAVLLGIIAAVLNVIPYIGGFVAVALPMMIALATKSSPWVALYVMGFYYVIQLIDNNYIVPIIVASKVRINALFSIIVVFVGNMLWGISGMFLSIPLLAIVKLIFDHIDSLKPWGFLLGDTMPPLIKVKPMWKKERTTPSP